MTPFEQERAKEIAAVLEFYHSDFTAYFAITIALAEALPEEINNQIRDAFTHLARAQKASEIELVQIECRAARVHIERANRDCLKASVIVGRAELDELVADVRFRHGFLTPLIESAYGQIKESRREAYLAETRGENDLIVKLEHILRQTLNLSDEIKTHYAMLKLPATRRWRHLKRWWRPIWFAGGILLGTALGVILRAQIDRVITWLLSIG